VWTFVGEASRRHCAGQIRGHHDAALGRLRNATLIRMERTLFGSEGRANGVMVAFPLCRPKSHDLMWYS
jgi:hypothetical protein